MTNQTTDGAGTHTPGPWVQGNTDPLLFGVKQGNGTKPIGFVYGPSFAERSANARLCAAAPDLLEALRELADDIADRFDMDSPSTNPGIKSTVAQARAAILKATTKPSEHG